MTEIQNVEQLLVLSGSEFIDAAYRSLLKREADPAGKVYYLHRLSEGESKAAVVRQLAASKEARALPISITGLEALIAEQKRLKHWFWGAVSRSRRMEKQANKLENELSLISQALTKLQADSGDRFARLDAWLSQPRSPGDVRLSDAPLSGPNLGPWVDTAGLSQPARKIFSRLTQASASRKSA